MTEPHVIPRSVPRFQCSQWHEELRWQHLETLRAHPNTGCGGTAGGLSQSSRRGWRSSLQALRPAHLNVAICMTQGLFCLKDAVALYTPAVVTILSSAMSLFDGAMIRAVNPGPAAAVGESAMPAPKINSFAEVVTAGPLSAVEPFPALPATTSSVVKPRYSKIRRSGRLAGCVKTTLTLVAPPTI